MSTEGSVGIAINITDNFTAIESKITSLNTSIASLDTNINRTRTINVKALLETTDFDKQIAAVQAREHTIKIKVNATEIDAMIAGAVTGGPAHTIRTTVDLANVKEIIKSSLNTEHPINVTVNSAGLETKVQAAIKNKSYPVQIDFTPDSAVGGSLSSITAAMNNIAKLTGEINKLTKTALGDLNSQMATYFNDLNHIIDLTNKVAATVETNETKKAEAADKAAKRMEDTAQKLADKTAELENKKATQAKKAADDATALAEKTKTDAIAKTQELADKQKEISAKAEASILKDKQESFAQYLKGTEAMIAQRIGIEEKQVQALKDLNQRAANNFKSSLNVILDGMNLIVEGHKKEEQAKLSLIDAENKLAEAKRKTAMSSANLGADTFQNRGLTGSKTQGMDTGFPISLGGTGKPSNQVEQAVGDAAARDKEIAALRKYASDYEQAYKMQYDMEKKLHNDTAAAYAENTARDRKYFLDREAAYKENVSREKKYASDLEQAYKMNYEMEKKLHNDIAAAYQENTARDRKMFLDREAAYKENYEMEKRNHMMLKEAYGQNESFDKQKRMDRGKAIYSGEAIMTSRQDIANLREYVKEQGRLHDTLGMVHSSINMVTNALMQMGVYLSVKQLMDYADHWMHFTSTVKVAMHSMIDSMQRLSGETDILSKDQQKLLVASKIDEVFKISQETRTSIEGTATLFGRMSRAAEAMGMSNKVAMTLTKELGQALMISGLSTNSARGALLQLEQAFGGVIVRGQEFKSVNDGLPIVMQTIIKHYNEAKVSIEAMNAGLERGTEGYKKYMAEHNKAQSLTMKEGRSLMLNQQMFSAPSAEALILSEKELAELSKDVEKTFEQSFNYIGNAFAKYIGELNEASGASKSFSEIAKVIGDNFELIGTVVLGLGVALGTYVAAIGVATIATRLFAGALSTNIYATALAVLITLGLEIYNFSQISKNSTSEMNIAWQSFWKTFDESDNPMVMLFKAIKQNFETFKADIVWMIDKYEALKSKTGGEDGIIGKIGSGISTVLHVASPVAGAAYDALSGAKSEKGSFGDEYGKNKDLIRQQLKNEELQRQADVLKIDRTLEGLEARINKEVERRKIEQNKEDAAAFSKFATAKVLSKDAKDNMTPKENYIDTDIKEWENKFLEKANRHATEKIELESLLKLAELDDKGKENRLSENNSSVIASIFDEWKKGKAAMAENSAKMYDLKVLKDAENARIKQEQTFQANLPQIQESNIVYMEGQASKIEDIYKKLGVTMKKTMQESYVDVVNDINEKSAVIKPRIAPPSSKEVLGLIEKYSKEFNVDSNLVKGVIQQESAWKTNAHNKSGASGLMQVMPANFSAYGITDPNNADQNIRAGIKILSEDIKAFGGSVKLGLAAYNYGGGNVRKVDKDFSRMPSETQNYVPAVMGYAKEFAAGKTGRLAPEDSADLKEKATEVKKVMTEAITPDFSKLSQPLRNLMDEELKLATEMQAKKETIKTKEEQQNFELDKKRLTSIENQITRQVDLEKTADAKFDKEMRGEMALDKVRNTYSNSMKNFKEEQMQSVKMASMISEKGAYAVDELNQMAAANFEQADAAKQLEANLREVLEAESKRSVYNEDANIQAQNELEKKQKILGIIEQINDASAAAKQGEKLGKDAESSVKNVTANAYKQVDKLKAENQSIFAATGTGKAFAVADKRMELDKAVGNILDPEAKKKFQAEADALLKSMQLKLDVELRVANIEEFKTGLSTLTQSLGEDLGKVGEALTGIAGHFADIALSNEKLAGQAEMEKNAYEEKLKSITGTDEKANKQKLELTEAYNKEKEKIESKGTKAQLDGFANIAGAASTMFGEQTRGRKALHALEITLHATSMAMTLVETAANVASGAAKFFAQSGWAGFAGVAAMLALMGTLGYAIGGGGGSSKPQDTSAPETKSTGSIFGDKEGSSKSIENIVSTLNDIHYKEYDALLSIGDNFKMLSKDVNGAVILAVNQQGGFAGSTKQASASALNPAGSPAMIGAGIAGSVALGATGALSQVGLVVGAQLVNAGATSLGIGMSTAAASSAAMATTVGTALGAGTSAMASAIGGAVLGLAGGLVFAALQYGLGKLLGIGKTKFEVIGAGIMTTATDYVIDGAAKALTVYDYSKIKQTTKGWFSDTVKIYDIVNGINTNMTGTFTSIFVNFKNIIGGMAKELDIAQFFDRVFTIPKMKISLKGLKSDEVNKKITDTINTVMDDIVTSVQNGFLTEFQRMGEGMLETFNRVATEALVVKATFKNMNMDIGNAGMGLITFSQAIVNVFESSVSAKDGLKNFIKAMSDLYKVATTGGQKSADTAEQLSAKLVALNTQAIAINSKSSSVGITTNLASDVADLKLKNTTVDAATTAAAKELPKAVLTALTDSANKDIRGQALSTEALTTRLANIYGTDSGRYKTAMANPDKLKLNSTDILSLKSSAAFDNTEAGKLLSAYRDSSSGADAKTAAKTKTFADALDASTSVLTKQAAALVNLSKATDVTNPSGMDRYFTGMSTNTVANQGIASGLITKTINDKAMPNTSVLMSKTIGIDLPILEKDPTKLTQGDVFEGQNKMAAATKTMSGVTSGLAALQKLVIPSAAMAELSTLDKANDIKTFTKGQRTAAKTPITSDEFMHLTSSQLNADMLERVMGVAKNKKGEITGIDTETSKTATLTGDTKTGKFWEAVQQMILNNDKVAKQIEDIKKSKTGATDFVTTNFGTAATLGGKDNFNKLVEQVGDIVNMSDAVKRDDAFKSLQASYGDLNTTVASYAANLSAIAPNFGDTLAFSKSVLDIQESYLSKVTTELETKNRAYAESLKDLNDETNISALLTDQTKTAITAWTKTLDENTKTAYGLKEVTSDVVDEQGNQITSLAITERAIKAFDNSVTSLSGTLQSALTALKNFQTSISDWVQNQKVTQIGNTKSQMDAASRKYDQLLLQISNPATSAEDKTAAMTKITGAADSMLTAIRNYYGTSKTGADMSAKIIDQMDSLPDALTTQELMLGELQKIKENTAVLPSFVGMSKGSTDTIDTLSKAIAAAMAIDKTNPTLANTTILDAKANIMLVLSKATEGATSEDAIFINNLVSAVGGGKGLSATVDAVVNAKLGTTTTEDVLNALKTSFAGLEVEVEKVKLNPTAENIKNLQADIDKFKGLTATVNANVASLKLNPDDAYLKQQLQNSINDLTDFTAKVTGIEITGTAKRAAVTDLKSTFADSTFKINPALSNGSVIAMMSDLRDRFNTFIARVSITDNPVATATLKESIRRTFATIDSKVFASLNQDSKLAVISSMNTAFDHFEATIDSTLSESKKQIALTSLNRAFGIIPSLVTTNINESARIAAVDALKVSFKTITTGIAPMVNEDLKLKAQGILDKAFDSIDATINSSVGEATKKITFNALKNAFSTITASINSDVNETSQALALTALEKGFKAVNANIVSDLDDGAKYSVANELKTAFGKMTDIISVELDPKTMDKALTAMDKAFSGIDALITSNVDQKTKLAAVKEMSNAFSTIKALVESKVDEESKYNAIDSLERGFSTVEAIATASISPASKTNAVNSLKNALAGIQAMINDVVLNPTDSNIAQLNAKIKRFGNLTASVDATIEDLNIGNGTEAQLARDISAIDDLTADVGLGVKSGAATDLNSQIAALTSAIKNIKVTLKIDFDSVSDEAVSRVEGIQDISQDPMVFKIQVPQISTATVDNLTNALKESTAEAAKMITTFDSMLSNAQQVQSAIDIFANGNTMIAAYIPLAGEVRGKEGYKKLADLTEIEAQMQLTTTEKQIKTYTDFGQDKIKTEKDALKLGSQLYYDLQTGSSKYNIALSYVEGYNSTHSQDIPQKVHVLDGAMNEESYAAGAVLGKNPKTDANNALAAYNRALAIIKSSSDEYYKLIGYNQGGQSPSFFAQGGAFTNGIVSTPTAFNMGVMGEAGPEAIMPLVQTSGGLGVRAMPAANDNNNNSEEELREVKKQNQILMAQNAILQEGFKQLINVNTKQADSLDNIDSNNRRKSA